MKATEITQNKPLIFVDIDGVLADLFGYIKQLHNVDHHKRLTKEQFEKFFIETDAEDLFSNLPMFANANELLQIIKDMCGEFSILSSPLQFNKEGSIKGKKFWLANNITVPATEWIFEHNKYIYATQPNGTPNILIDDFNKNVQLWKQHGGIGIKWQNDEDSLDKLKAKLKVAFI